jgi:hypothetical protein
MVELVILAQMVIAAVVLPTALPTVLSGVAILEPHAGAHGWVVVAALLAVMVCDHGSW